MILQGSANSPSFILMRVILDCVGWRTCPLGERSDENHNFNVTTNFTYVLTNTHLELELQHYIYCINWYTVGHWLLKVSLSDPRLVTITAELSISVYLCMANLSVSKSRVVTLIFFKKKMASQMTP